MEDVAFVADASGVESRTGTNALVKGNVAEEAHPDGGRRGVGYAHLAKAEHLAALLMACIDQVDAHTQGAVILFFGHSWFVQEVARARSYLSVENAGYLGEVVIHTHIDNAQMEAMLAAEHVHASPTLGEVYHLLPSDFAWGNADPFTFDAVIATQEKMAGMRQRGRECLLGKANLHSQRFQPTKSTFRLVEVIDFLLDDGA